MKMKICAGGYLIKEDLFLFAKRSENKKWAPNVWDIAGGHAKKEETAYDALVRETFEELSVTVKKAELLQVMHVWDESQHDYFEYHIYVITSWDGEPINASKEHTEIRWFNRQQLNELPLAMPDYLSLIDKWMNNRK